MKAALRCSIDLSNDGWDHTAILFYRSGPNAMIIENQLTLTAEETKALVAALRPMLK